MANFSSIQADWPEPISVTINGTEYPTQSYGGVQRFVPDPAVEELINLSMDHFGSYGRPGSPYYPLIPQKLREEGHSNPVVNYFVEQNKAGYFGLNELVLALHAEEFKLEDWIEFETLHGLSVGGFLDAVESQISNLGLGVSYIDEEDGQEYEDYSAVLEVVNPLWEE